MSNHLVTIAFQKTDNAIDAQVSRVINHGRFNARYTPR
jgi:hypothetical protein